MNQNENSKRPGIMLYFETLLYMERLTLSDKGRLLDAMLRYGQYGEVPTLCGKVGVAFDACRPRLDADRCRYESVVEKRRLAALKRWSKA